MITKGSQTELTATSSPADAASVLYIHFVHSQWAMYREASPTEPARNHEQVCPKWVGCESGTHETSGIKDALFGEEV